MASTPEYFLGMDGGGSRCRARIRNAAGDVLGEAIGGPSNLYQDFEAAVSTILKTADVAATKAGTQS